MGNIAQQDPTYAISQFVNFDRSQEIINQFMTALQSNFQKEKHYQYPLISPQINIVFAFDKQVADEMMDYMSLKLKDVAGFDHTEFRFIRKSGPDGEGLQRLRLEFTRGITTEILCKLTTALDRFDKKPLSNY